jgi:hypothetical protein
MTLLCSRDWYDIGGVDEIDQLTNVLGELVELDGSVLDRLVGRHVEKILDKITVSSDTCWDCYVTISPLSLDIPGMYTEADVMAGDEDDLGVRIVMLKVEVRHVSVWHRSCLTSGFHDEIVRIELVVREVMSKFSRSVSDHDCQAQEYTRAGSVLKRPLSCYQRY